MCLIPTGITSSSCDGFAFGGIDKIYLANKDYMTPRKNSAGTITGFTMTSSQKFYRFGVADFTGQLLEELQTGSANRFVQQTVNMQITDISQEKKEILEALANARVAAIVQLQTGQYKLAGEYGVGLKATTLTIDSGTQLTDPHSATIALVGGSLGYANEITAAAVTANIA
jgi:hypothetical protein